MFGCAMEQGVRYGSFLHQIYDMFLSQGSPVSCTRRVCSLKVFWSSDHAWSGVLPQNSKYLVKYPQDMHLIFELLSMAFCLLFLRNM
jgi:hypothetical protein